MDIGESLLGSLRWVAQAHPDVRAACVFGSRPAGNARVDVVDVARAGAFLALDALVKWLPRNGFTERTHRQGAPHGRPCRRFLQDVVHELHDGQEPLFRRGLPRAGADERIRYSDTFDDPNLPGAMQPTIHFKRVSCGTEVTISQEGAPDVIPAQACYLGWQESLALLAELVEAEIPDAP